MYKNKYEHDVTFKKMITIFLFYIYTQKNCVCLQTSVNCEMEGRVEKYSRSQLESFNVNRELKVIDVDILNSQLM